MSMNSTCEMHDGIHMWIFAFHPWKIKRRFIIPQYIRIFCLQQQKQQETTTHHVYPVATVHYARGWILVQLQCLASAKSESIASLRYIAVSDTFSPPKYASIHSQYVPNYFHVHISYFPVSAQQACTQSFQYASINIIQSWWHKSPSRQQGASQQTQRACSFSSPLHAKFALTAHLPQRPLF